MPTREYVGVDVRVLHICEAPTQMYVGVDLRTLHICEAPTQMYVGVCVRTLHICEAPTYVRGTSDGISVSHEAHRERHGCVDLRTLHIC